MAFVDNDVAVVGEEVGVRVGSADRLGRDDVDVSAEFLGVAAVLADGGGVEKLGESFAPLRGELYVGNDDCGWYLAVCD